MDRQRRTLLWVIVLVGLFAATTALGLACASSGDDDDDDDTADDDTADDDDTTDDDTSDDDTVDDDDDDLGDDDTTIADTFSEAEANVGDWVWIPVVGNLCRDGSQTGIAVRLQEGEGSDDLMIFLQGGGACADKDSCDANPAKYGKTQMQADTSLNAGILSDGTGSESNVSEFANWNNVVIPYCTGDLHVGFEENGKAEGVEARQIYVGIRNMRNVADLIGQYFTGLKRVFIVGQDAGGMGTNWAAIEFEAAFDDNTIRVFNDSFPMPKDNNVFSVLEQTGFKLQWGIELPEDCENCTGGVGNSGMEFIQQFIALEYDESTFGLFSYAGDETMRNLYGEDVAIDANAYENSLVDLRNNVLKDTEQWSVYIAPGTGHGIVTSPEYFTMEVGDKMLTDWVSELATPTLNQPPASVGP